MTSKSHSEISWPLTNNNIKTELKSIICWLLKYWLKYFPTILLKSKNWVNMHNFKSILTSFWKKKLWEGLVIALLWKIYFTSLLLFTSFRGALIWSEGHSCVAQTRSLFFLEQFACPFMSSQNQEGKTLFTYSVLRIFQSLSCCHWAVELLSVIAEVCGANLETHTQCDTDLL